MDTDHRDRTSMRPTTSTKRLIEAHRDLTRRASHALNARLVLLLANHIGSLAGAAAKPSHAARTGAEPT